jgi:hypothetical protein
MKQTAVKFTTGTSINDLKIAFEIRKSERNVKCAGSMPLSLETNAKAPALSPVIASKSLQI